MTATSPPPHTEEALVSEAPRTLLQRLNAVMQEVSYVQKDKQISMQRGSYKAVTHDAVTAKVRPSLVKHGILYYPVRIGWANHIHAEPADKARTWRTEVDGEIRFVNIDDKDDYIDVPTLGFGLDTGDKGPGKAMSYAVKYALLKTLGLETGEDADNEASPEKPEPSGQKAERGPKGGRAKKDSDADTLVLNVGKDAYSYPFNGWDNIREFITDLHAAVDGSPGVWDINQNDIRRVKDKITMAGHVKLIDQLQEVELFVEQQALAGI